MLDSPFSPGRRAGAGAAGRAHVEGRLYLDGTGGRRPAGEELQERLDGQPEEAPREPPAAVHRPEDIGGNQVVVQIRPDVWAMYEHLQPGNIDVRVGDRVAAGQPLGRLGNSGNSDAPHLHFQLSDGPDILTSNSLPYLFDRYTLSGKVDGDAYAAAFSDPSAPAVGVHGTPRAQTGTHPLVLGVVAFP